MEHTYSPRQFGKLIGKSVNTLQKWDRKGILPAFRSPTNRRYYTKDLAMQKEAIRAYCQEHGMKVDQWMEVAPRSITNARALIRSLNKSNWISSNS